MSDGPSPHRRSRTMRVVAGLIRRDGEVLLTQRRPGRHLGLSWEFPGGKVEEGESDEEALRREMDEELGVEVRVGSRCFETRHSYGPREMHLLVYRCELVSGEPKALDVNAVEWVAESELEKRNFLPADLPLVHGIATGLVALDAPVVEDDDDDDDDEEREPVVAAQVISRPSAAVNDDDG